jgi:CRP-like cAMP-binding protein
LLGACAGDLLLVPEGDWFERKEGFAGLIHRFNLFFKPPRRDHRAKFAVEINEHRSAPRGRLAEDTANITTIGYVRSGHARTDAYNITGSRHVFASTIAQGDIVAAAGVATKRQITDGIVANPRSIGTKRQKTDSIVRITVDVANERPDTNSCVLACLAQPAGIIVLKREITDGGVVRGAMILFKSALSPRALLLDPSTLKITN